VKGRWIQKLRAGLRVFRVIQSSAPSVVGWRRRLQNAVDTRGTVTLTTEECAAILQRGRPLFELADRIESRMRL